MMKYMINMFHIQIVDWSRYNVSISSYAPNIQKAFILMYNVNTQQPEIELVVIC